MHRFFLISVAAAALAACGSSADSQSRDPHAEDAQVQPDAVSSEALQAAVDDDAVRRFYESRGWRPVWTAENAGELLAALDEAPRHALARDMYLDDSASTEPAAREASLTTAALNYATALARGQTDPEEIREIYTVPRPKFDAAAGLTRAISAGQVGQWLASLPPQTAEYRALSEAYVRYAQEAERQTGPQIDSGDLIRPGESDDRVPRIVEALRANGYLGQNDGQQQDPRRYSDAIAEAVERLQEDFGIATDGVVGPDTLELLNTGARDRARKLAINMERLRWLERDPPKTRVDVNTAAAHLDYWRDGRHRDRRRVVVGQPGWETPALGSPMFRLVANPTWTVPKSIEEEEIAPKGAAYLRRNNMVRRDGWIVQQPGPDNALGEVKFDMQNDNAIYLHDTPAKQLFSENQRHLSHGCVRVEDALGFARMIAEHDGIKSQFDKALATGDDTFVDLNSDIPVRLLYHTAFVEGGKVRFRTDAYGWDEDVAKALGREARERREVTTHFQDVGP